MSQAALVEWPIRAITCRYDEDVEVLRKNMSATESQSPQSRQIDAAEEKLRAIAYSLDCLVPGFYAWLGPLKLRIGGSVPEASYPGIIHSKTGIALVLPGYRIYSTYQGNLDFIPLHQSASVN